MTIFILINFIIKRFILGINKEFSKNRSILLNKSEDLLKILIILLILITLFKSNYTDKKSIRPFIIILWAIFFTKPL